MATVFDEQPGETTSERRRREVVDAARRVIVERGLEATSLRRIARVAGFTTGVVTHHFPHKQAVIVAAFEGASADWHAEVRGALAAAADPAERVVALARVAIPSDPARRAEWRLWSEMWTYAGRNPEFARRLVATDALWEGMIREVLAEARGAGLVRAGLDIAAEANVLARLVDGLGLRAWLSGGWEQARARLADHLGTLGVPRAICSEALRG
jgi:AcrR family transcriptional regulator